MKNKYVLNILKANFISVNISSILNCKKIYAQIAVACIALVSISIPAVKAQNTMVLLNYASSNDSSNLCPAPKKINFFMYGYSTGYVFGQDSLVANVNFGDGHDTTFKTPLSQFFANFYHTYQHSGDYSVQYIITGPDGKADTITNYSEVVIGDTCGNIKGMVYIDNNSNCVFDPGEVPMVGMPVKLVLSSQIIAWSYTDSKGEYNFNVPTGNNYEVQIGTYTQYGYGSVCPASGFYSNITAPSLNNDFALTCSGGFDLTGSLTGWGFRPGFTANLNVSAMNINCLPVSGQIKLVLDSLVSFSSASTMPDAINGDTLIWNFTGISNVNFYNYWYNLISTIKLTTSLNAMIGDTVCFELILTPNTADANPSNNSITACFPVRNSWDPNIKDVVPLGIGSTGKILPNTNPFTYTVQFQNTGNDTAYNIFILDTLSSNLDINTFKTLSSSDEMKVSMLEGDVVKFTFNNIMLPDSNTNEAESHGYVTYSISQKPNLSEGTEIKNKAGIYFDFNPPVITNYTIHTIDLFTSIEKITNQNTSLNVFPNPSNGISTIRYFISEKSEIDLNLFDLLGNKIMRIEQMTKSEGTYQTEINTNHLPAGIYYLLMKTEKGSSGKKLVVIK